MIEALHKRKVICRAVTYEGTDIICFAPPLIINQSQVDSLIERVKGAIEEVKEGLKVV
ncbi:hypothetical protein J11TS1_27110 [Oceanobacillus sp. J11TS1]|nr:hypothetical protein J11TS1_27110 [Oceanobacillus sp. J11TS1]